MSADKQTRSKNRKSSSDLQRLSSRFMSGLLRSLFLIHKPARFRQAGFVLPTTVLLLLVLTLTTGALSFRAFSRSGNVVALREQQVVDSAAAPAVDRAKAKLEYLFAKDSRFPGGIPSSDVIASMMLNDNTNGIPKITLNDPYTFPKETRLDINGDSKADNAWVFPSDVDGNGTIEADELVTYSILMDDEVGVAGTPSFIDLSKELTPAKAKALVTRNGPINTSESVAGCGSARAPEAGWQVINTATLQKNFQITAFVANRSSVNRTVSAIELQQVRQADRGNKWGAWFKYDLELFPGATRDFFWNGAMHTEGNLLVRDKYKARMISSHNSCLYNEPASEITLASIPASDNPAPNNQPAFLGQLLSAQTDANDFSGSSSDNSSPGFHQFTSNTQAPTQDTDIARLGTDNDSVTASREHLRNILLDPIKLFTTDVSANRSTAGWSRDASWNNRRITNKASQVPYLDDTYRADNRYGPKAVYNKDNKIPAGTSVGTPIAGNSTLTNLDATNSLYGLDGYWERRAIGQGLRVIVGQRLELGNKFGWKGVAETNPDLRDPLYPTRIDTSTETRQKRSLYDNLAAVQGMVVYHYRQSGGTLPLACIASTAHPGTPTTLINSRTFNTIDIGGTAKVNTDFFSGVGTNGWEFAFPYTTDTSFSSAINVGAPLGKILRNLAYFAGDSLGGAPSFQPTQDGNVHPAPNMAAWGDFSNLRRIFGLVDAGTTYASLSPADKSTLHSATCTVGMLTYNLNNEIKLYAGTLTSLNSLGTQLRQLFDGTGSGGAADIDTYIGKTGTDSSVLNLPLITSGTLPKAVWNDTVDNSLPGPNKRLGCNVEALGVGAYSPVCDAGDYFAQFSTEDFLRVLGEQNALGATLNARRDQAAALLKGSQFTRDRLLGFRPGYMPNPSPGTGTGLPWDSDTGVITNTAVAGGELIAGCDPDIFSGADAPRIGLSLAFCQGITNEVKYPSLYYLFPFFDHDHNGFNNSLTSGIFLDHTQPPTEEYIADAYVTTSNTNGSESNYSKLTNTNIDDLGGLFVPRATDFSDWKLPTTAPLAPPVPPAPLPLLGTGTVLTDPGTQPFRITMGTSGRDITLLDKGMYDGRELMSVRMLDLDIQKLAEGTADGTIAGDRWISNVDGIVYAFREDAIREDAIVRPKASGTNWSNCDEWSEVYSNSSSSPFSVTGNNRDCRLKKLSSPPFLQDPPLMTGSNISTKPIDFYADPDRRPYGFRLVNGATLNRASNVQSGMTFVTDNMVYVKGNFNLHSSSGALGASATACSNLIEEFTARLIANDCTLVPSTTTDFYDGRASTQRNNDFALPATDKWRPVEIVGDAVGVLSPSFKDGNIEHGFTLARQEGEWGYATSSYQNQNRLKDNASVSTNSWKHVGDNTTPILVDRNGGVTKDDSLVDASSFIRLTDTLASPDKFSNKRGGDLQPATRTIVNAVFISGIIPSQAGQTYGGMHNFPRFLEHWRSVDLHISGGFFQLNFSTSATAPFDQDAWEPGNDPKVNDERIRFYGAPNRLWGYDVGLQYAPAGPISRRFVEIGRPRSEFYRELPVDDPYVTNLRCAKYTNNNRVNPNESCPA